MKALKYSFLMLLVAFSTVSCVDYLDVNTNPNVPQAAPAHLLLPPMFTGMGLAIQLDGQFIGKYTQYWAHSTAFNVWDQHSYAPASDQGGECWRTHYFAVGKNVDLMIDDARARNLPAYIALGYAIRAWTWQTIADMHGDAVIVKEAFNQSLLTFNFDSQELAYAESNRLCDSALFYLDAKGLVDPNFNAADLAYNGDLLKWKRFVNGVIARNAHRLTNKSSYNADKVIAACDASIASNADNFQILFASTKTQDGHFYGTLRDNLRPYRATKYVVGLLNGTNSATQGSVDPRLRLMLPQNSATDTVIAGVDPTFGLATGQLTPTLWGTTLNPSASGVLGRWMFSDKARFPIMTYSELQFIKAEAQFRKNDKAGALVSYKKAIDAHVDFANSFASITGNAPTTAVTAAQKTTLLANTRIVPTVADSLTMDRIMLQKYVALWGWGFLETWNDMRRFRYGSDKFKGETVYSDFKTPDATRLFAGNGGKLAYNVRPRYNSEYIWNRAALEKIGGYDVDYHTREPWFIKP
jgi:Starch-binding associating with outer membrane